MIIQVKLKSKKAQAVLDRVGKNITHLNPALIQIAGMLEGASDQAFRSQGPGWKPLKPATVKQRGASGPILNRRGGRGLVGSVTSHILGDTVFIGSNLVYAAIHQFGGIIGIHNIVIPAREYIIIGKREIAKASAFLTKHLLSGT